uniref:Uncharacterized protein n=1 Tax=Pseudoalteromonas translucida (strain TAC 125) TaxID=326442 RepID=A0A6G6ARV1_PSET1|nr:hypothetical protein [Pseudoalteromonas translucida]QID24508.1 hypothetical protein PSHA_p00015 [Pseudoalteromonas translucida TAC125]
MIGKKFSVFKQIANRKGWTFEDIGNQRDIDAANGLQNKRGDNNLGLTDELNADTDLSGKAHLDHHVSKGLQ